MRLMDILTRTYTPAASATVATVVRVFGPAQREGVPGS